MKSNTYVPPGTKVICPCCIGREVELLYVTRDIADRPMYIKLRSHGQTFTIDVTKLLFDRPTIIVAFKPRYHMPVIEWQYS